MGKKSQLGWFEKQLRTNCIKIILRNILNTRLTTLKQKTNKELQCLKLTYSKKSI